MAQPRIPIIPGSTGRPTLNPSERNRQGQRRRDRQRHLQNLVKNNLALDLKHSAAEVWLLGPQAENLAKNNLAFSQVLILPTVPLNPAPAAGS